jgi:hypothetical protein
MSADEGDVIRANSHYFAKFLMGLMGSRWSSEAVCMVHHPQIRKPSEPRSWKATQLLRVEEVAEDGPYEHGAEEGDDSNFP